MLRTRGGKSSEERYSASRKAVPFLTEEKHLWGKIEITDRPGDEKRDKKKKCEGVVLGLAYLTAVK